MEEENKERVQQQKRKESVTFPALGGKVGGGQGSHSLSDFLAAQKAFVSLMKAPKQTLGSLPASDKLDLASNSMSKTSCTISGT